MYLMWLQLRETRKEITRNIFMHSAALKEYAYWHTADKTPNDYSWVWSAEFKAQQKRTMKMLRVKRMSYRRKFKEIGEMICNLYTNGDVVMLSRAEKRMWRSLRPKSKVVKMKPWDVHLPPPSKISVRKAYRTGVPHGAIIEPVEQSKSRIHSDIKVISTSEMLKKMGVQQEQWDDRPD